MVKERIRGTEISEKAKSRIGYIDAMKGFAIVLVVLGHVIDGMAYFGTGGGVRLYLT